MKDNLRLDYYMVNPVRIVVLDNAAVVDYYFSYYISFTMGEQMKQEEGYGKIAEFYIREEGKWLLLGDLTVHDEDEDE